MFVAFPSLLAVMKPMFKFISFFLIENRYLIFDRNHLQFAMQNLLSGAVKI